MKEGGEKSQGESPDHSAWEVCLPKRTSKVSLAEQPVELLAGHIQADSDGPPKHTVAEPSSPRAPRSAPPAPVPS